MELGEVVREPNTDTVARASLVLLPDAVEVFDMRIVSEDVTEPRTLTELVVEADTVLLLVADPVGVDEAVTLLEDLIVVVELGLAVTVFVGIEEAVRVLVT